MVKPQFKGVYDTLDIYRRFYPNLPNHKLETLSREFPIKHSPSHNALDDIKATAYLLVHAIRNNIQDTFPTYQSVKKGILNEEKRLFYVAITRAKKKLYLSSCSKNKWGKESYPSRFIQNIDVDYID